ncbi:MAG: flagellar basal body P-ring formation protein FlgA [Planctomycetaceae bacterium]|nr:flagellar basal body P-ring formation protein FlgA [Planctomycetaceae bacterium]
MKTRLPLRLTFAAVAFCAGWLPGVSPQTAVADEIRVHLNAQAVVSDTTVLLGSIATVSCHDPRQTKAVEVVDVKLLDITQPSETISQRLVRIRLILAGYKIEDLRMTGADQTVVVFQPPQKLTDAQVEQQALEVLSQAFNVAPEDLRVTLQSGFVQSLSSDIRGMDALELKILPPSRRSLGQVTLSLQLWKDNGLLLTRSAVFDVRRRHRVAVARVSLSREVPINETNVQFENRFLSTEVDELEPNQILGRNVRGMLVSGSVVQMRDLQTTARPNSDMLVRKGDSIQVIAIARQLRTSIRNIEALEDGRLGDRIRMKNRDSGREIVGEVLGPGQAIVRVR